MATPTLPVTGSLIDAKLQKSSPGKIGGIVFAVMLIAGIVYIWSKLAADLSIVHNASIFPFILLGVALFIALGLSSSTASTTPRMPSPPASTPTRWSRTSPWSTPAS